MNVFCHPQTLGDPRVWLLLGEEPGSAPEFGYKARVPLAGGKFDRTEVDMRLGNLLVEAKLTEPDFQRCPCAALAGYRDFAEVSDQRRLPRFGGRHEGYQLIRNVLAAHATGASFCLLHDARRPDLRELCYQVMKCVKPLHLRLRSKVLTWQELTDALPAELQNFLEEKYGILSASAGTTG